MANPYKKIVLLKGLEPISDYQFDMIKSLLAKELKLNRKEGCNRIRMADLLEDKFRSDCGLGKLIELFKDIPELQDLAETLKKEKSKVQRKSKVKEATLGQNNNQDEPSGAPAAPANNADLKPKKCKTKAVRTEDSESIQEQNQHLEASVTDTQQTQGSSQTPKPRRPPSYSNSSTERPGAVPAVTGKNEKGKACPQPPGVEEMLKRIQMVVRKQNVKARSVPQLPGTSATNKRPAKPQPKPQPQPQPQPQLQPQPQSPPNPPPSTPSSSTAKKPRVMLLPKEPANVVKGYHREPKEVMVLTVTPLFVYHSDKTMFHATVATESEFFRVKVFDVKLQAMFTPNKIVILSEYFGKEGFLEIYSHNGVCPGKPELTMNIPPTMKQNARATPKISYLCSLHPGKFVNGTFQVHKKYMRSEFIYYEIQDNTGKMEVVVFGRLTSVDCEEGDKLKLICFELAKCMDKWMLRTVFHSYMEVIKSRKGKTQIPTSDNDTFG